METGPQIKVSSDRLVKSGIEPVTPGVQGKWFIHYTAAAPSKNGLPTPQRNMLFLFDVKNGSIADKEDSV